MSTHCIVGDLFGIYVPQQFIKNYGGLYSGIDEQDRKDILSGPENDSYWEAWDSVIQNAYRCDHRCPHLHECTRTPLNCQPDGIMWRLFQDGDLFEYDDNGEQFV